MTNRVIGPGIGLPPPQLLYPANLQAAGDPYTPGSNVVSLAPGQSIQIPAGDWFIDLGKYSILEFQEPVQSATTSTQLTGVWRPLRTQRGSFPIFSDGNNYRVSNLTGCAVSAIVTNGGTSYVQASTTVTPSTGNSTWQAIVGGRLSPITLTALGSGYGVAPTVYIPAPPAPGVQATAVATISSGALTAITLVNAGAGYTSVPAITLLPNPYDPNFATISNAAALAFTTGSGAVSAVLCTNPGVPVATTMTLTVAGAGTSALVSPNFLTSLTALTFSALGSGTFFGGSLTTYAGLPSATPAVTNPQAEDTNFLPRQALVNLAATTGTFTASSASTVIIDGGMFLGTAQPIINVYGGTVVNAPTVTLTQGGVNDTVIIQPL